MSDGRRQSVIDGLHRWVTWIESNNKNKSTSSSIGSLYHESITSRFNNPFYKYQPFNYECVGCEKQYLKLPADKNDKPQHRCTRCGHTLKKTNEGVTGKKVFAGLIHETGRNTHDPVAEIYNSAVKRLPDIEQAAIYWKFLSPEDQSTFAERQGISTAQLQQSLSKAYLYVMGFLDGHNDS